MAKPTSGDPTYSVFLTQPRDDRFQEGDIALRVAPYYYGTWSYDVGNATRWPKVGADSPLFSQHKATGAPILKDNQLLTVLQAVAAEKNPHVMLVCHGGSRSGPWFDFAKKGYENTCERMGILLYLLKLRRLRQRCEHSDRRADWEALGKWLPDDPRDGLFWSSARMMLEEIDQKTRERNAWAKSKLAAADLATVKATLTRKANDRRDAMWQLLGLDPTADKKLAYDLVDAVRDVHKVKIERLELRACRVGDDADVLRLIGRFFGAKAVRAPKVFIRMALVQVKVLPTLSVFRNPTVQRPMPPPPPLTYPANEEERQRRMEAHRHKEDQRLRLQLLLAPTQRPRVTTCTPSSDASPEIRNFQFRHLYQYRFLNGTADEVFLGLTVTGGKVEGALVAESRDALFAFVRQMIGTARRGDHWLKTDAEVPLQFVPGDRIAPTIFSNDPEYARRFFREVEVTAPPGEAEPPAAPQVPARREPMLPRNGVRQGVRAPSERGHR